MEQEQWHVVKAIAGCETDSIEGVKGIGDILAAKFLRGLVKEGSKTYQKIEQGEAIWKRNMELVKLPLEGTKTFPIVEDETTQEKWDTVTGELGMKRLNEKNDSVVKTGFGVF